MVCPIVKSIVKSKEMIEELEIEDEIFKRSKLFENKAIREMCIF